MRFKPWYLLSLAILLMSGCNNKQQIRLIEIIPEPFLVEQSTDKAFALNNILTVHLSDSAMLPAISLLKDITRKDIELLWSSEKTNKEADFVFQIAPELDSLSHEGYILDINSKQVLVQSAGAAGIFYAVESIRQLLPASFDANTPLKLKACRITDKPCFTWRGMHLDVSRHFMPTSFIKKYIDYLAMHKLNVFHWHLVDGIGWRIEIKSHPELTSIGAWRKVKPGLKPWQEFEVWREGDKDEKYGGYYTQDEIREVVAYAAQKHITVIPEIELPGHSEVVFQCYPHLACKDANGQHIKDTGVYCASNSQGYQLLEEVLEEVLELFPSEYIHIGGDEVNKKHWNECPDCLKMMKQNAYDAHELQSHFINHFDTWLKNKNRKLIGWHEILEGQLSPSATVMFWASEKQVKEYLKKGHPTVLTTGSHLYFDHYQSMSKHEPKAFGGNAPLKKVYDYEPIPADLEPQYADLVMGVQANIWTEYMPNEQQVEYMLFPRIAALSEIAWQQKGTKDWQQFRQKMDVMVKRYESLGVNYAHSALRPEIKFEFLPHSQQMEVTIETELNADIHYTIDGSEPTHNQSMAYKEPFLIDASTSIKAIAVKNGVVYGETEVKEAILHKAAGAEVILNCEPTDKYSANGPYTLVDTKFGGDKWGNGKWLGILNQDFEAIINLKESKDIQSVQLSCVEETGAGIFYPVSFEVFTSEDGKNFTKAGSWQLDKTYQKPWSAEVTHRMLPVKFNRASAQYIKVKAIYPRINNMGVFLFIDEVVVE
ncbi:beta-N-acetylhexosaminidase [Carboxylicivirga marina]|uniref:beta-N-acetylhexosaminidase n=1 Tax=Carboxylicivirga marina TaxID=2800988 RepID=UPI00259A01E7|nr:family 20 glycosylhydrolase [uncultured Carboxylicivirga sp.]